jgi:hypothetical protein
MLDRFEYEYEYRDAEYEYEKKHEQSIGPKFSIERFSFALSLLLALAEFGPFVPRIGFRRTRTQRSGTQCNGTRTRWLFELRRCRSLIEAIRGNLRTNRPDSYT